MSILIISKEIDEGVDATVNWLTCHFKKKVLRITPDCDIRFSSFDIDNIKECVMTNRFGESIALKDVEAVWIHGFNSVSKHIDTDASSTSFAQQVFIAMSRNCDSIFFPIINKLRDCVERFIGEFSFDVNQKIKQLLYARECGLIIPKTTIVTSKLTAQELFGASQQLIVKGFDRGIFIQTDEFQISSQKTVLIDDSMIDGKAELFEPSLVQEAIEKRFEIRSFFFADQFFSMAIFSQSVEQTKIDCRNDDSEKRMRCIPFSLPEEICEKLRILFKKLNLSTGSVDIIKNSKGDFVFLEINPCGQFGFVSEYCNFLIPKTIAKYLINEKRN